MHILGDILPQKTFSDQTHRLGRKITHREAASTEYFHIRQSRSWPQNLPLKFVSEPQILPPKL